MYTSIDHALENLAGDGAVVREPSRELVQAASTALGAHKRRRQALAFTIMFAPDFTTPRGVHMARLERVWRAALVLAGGKQALFEHKSCQYLAITRDSFVRLRHACARLTDEDFDAELLDMCEHVPEILPRSRKVQRLLC